MVAKSILEAASAMGGFSVPVVVRLQGTNSDDAMKMVGHCIRLAASVLIQLFQLKTSGLDLHTETDFEEAATKIIELTGRSR